MKPATTEDILQLLVGDTSSAALSAALEQGLFWLLAEKPLHAPDIAQSLKVSANRCRDWLKLLYNLGLLEDTAEGYTPSAVAWKTILNAYSRDNWAFLARAHQHFRMFAMRR